MNEVGKKAIERISRAAGFAVLLPLFLTCSTPSAAEVTIAFDPPDGIFINEETYSVHMTVDQAATDLRGFSIVLEFDAAVVCPVTVAPGSLLTGAGCEFFFEWLNSSAIGDSIVVDAAGLGCSIAGPGDLVTMRFAGVAPGVSPLRCRHGTLRDSLNEEIPYVCDEGTITYEWVSALQEGTWGRVKALVRDR